MKHAHSDLSLTRRSSRLRRKKSLSIGDIHSHNIEVNRRSKYPMERDIRALNYQPLTKSLEEVAFKTIRSNIGNLPKQPPPSLLKPGEKPIVYTRGVYRPQPVYWKGSNRPSASRMDDSRYSNARAWSIGNRSMNDTLGPENESGDSPSNSPQQQRKKKKKNIFGTDHNLSAPGCLSTASLDSADRPSAFAPPSPASAHSGGRKVPMLAAKSSSKRPRQIRSRIVPRPREESYRAPSVMEPNPVDMKQYSTTVRLWMEQVDRKTVLKSNTMFLSVMPPGSKLPKELAKSIPQRSAEEDTMPSQWIIARGRSIRKRKRELDGQQLRAMSESFNASGYESDGDNPMSPGRQTVLFFKITERWPDLAWVLFDGIQSDSETIRMVKDIELRNPSKLSEQIHDLMNRWWKEKGSAATIDELHRALELVEMASIKQEYFDPKTNNNFSFMNDDTATLDVGEIAETDPNVSRLSRQYTMRSLNASFNVENAPINSPAPFSANTLERRLQQRLLSQQSRSSPNLKTEQSSRLESQNWVDGSLARAPSKNDSFRMYASQDSLNEEKDKKGRKSKKKDVSCIFLAV